MGKRRGKRVNPFAAKKRERKNQNYENGDQRQQEPYEEIVRENELFMTYYKRLNICPEEDWEQFSEAIKKTLPTTFRVTGTREESAALLDIIKNEFFGEYMKGASEIKNEGESELAKPFCLPWYPNNLAWQLELSRKDIRRSEKLFRLHNFLISETSAGCISRQEAVSMIPPIVLDVKSHHKVLDMCAAPGSKTAQLIESLHSNIGEDKIPTGFVIANDIDNNRCYMLVHQAKRMSSPCFLVTNHDSSQLPNFLVTNKNNELEQLKFDRILCDVPCSGDGTLRKNPDIWLKWNTAQGLNLHGIQYRVARRGSELLTVGGRLVYSTCSFNPIENEAVLHRLVKESEGALEIIDATNLVPGLKYYPGMTYWEPASKDIEFYKTFDDVPEKWWTVIRPQMFPSNSEDIKQYHLERCMRVLPHQQNSGGFFVAVLEKKKLLPWENISHPIKKIPITANESNSNENEKKTEGGEVESGETNKDKENDKKFVPYGPQRKKRKIHGYKEDPFVFFKDDEDVWDSLKTFYEIDESFNQRCLLTRCLNTKKKNIYFCSEAVRDLVINNEDSVKIINTGVKTFARCDNKNMHCSFRLAQEGLPSSNPFIGESRRVILEKDDLIMLLHNTDPIHPPLLTTLTAITQKRVENLNTGSCILKYIDPKFTLILVGWRGAQSLRAYIDQNETIHLIRLLGADLSKYDINKFIKKNDVPLRKEEDEEQYDSEKKIKNNVDDEEDDDEDDEMVGDVVVEKKDVTMVEIKEDK